MPDFQCSKGHSYSSLDGFTYCPQCFDDMLREAGRKLKKRQKEILVALAELGGEATTRQIAEKVGLAVNGVSNSLGVLYHSVKCLGGKGGECRWKLK